MRKEIISGIVRKIECFDNFFSIITISSISLKDNEERKIKFYGFLTQDYLDRFVDIVNERSGLFRRKLTQTISTADISSSVRLKYSFVKELDKKYGLR